MTEDKFCSSAKAMSAEDRQEYLNQNIKRIVTFAYENAPTIRKKLDKAGVKPSQIRTTKDLELIPSLSRDGLIGLQEKNPPFGGLLAMPV
ncbi:MAG: hypothetical protein ABIB93_04050, partial [Chloroflexota bacterium]